MAYIAVQLRGGRAFPDGAVIDELGADVGTLLPSLDDDRYPLLRLVDPYGDTYFSSQQMIGLIPELELLAREVESPLMGKLIALAEECRGRRAYLVFVGD